MTQVPNYTVEDGDGLSVLAEITAIFGAVRDDNAGPSAPASPVAFMRWRDTSGSPAVLKVRNATNTAWVTLAEEMASLSFLRGSPVTKTADFTLAAGENVIVNNKSGSTCVVTLPAASAFPGREVVFQNLQARAVISASSNVIPLRGGSAGTAILPAIEGSFAVLVSNGTNWLIVLQSSAINLGTSVASTSGTSIDFTGIPTWARRVKLNFSGVSTNGTSVYQLQIGSGSITPSGYETVTAGASNAGAIASANRTTGLGLTVGTPAAANAFSGSVEIMKLSDHIYVFSGTGLIVGSTVFAVFSGVSPNLAGAMDRLRVTTVGGTDTFDAGTINISWE